MVGEEATHDAVKEYYGKILAKSADLKTNACCTAERPPQHVIDGLAKIHDDVLEKYYGCGFVAPDLLEGCSVLDLGCGAGRDVYLLAQFVGPSGSVVGLDMTAEQLEVAERHVETHRVNFNHPKAVTSFRQGYIERLADAGIADSTYDVIVSNCVVNLSPDKGAVLREAYRVLKTGGELYFSDVYASRRVPEALRSDSVLHGECLSGALYWGDFLKLAKECGFGDPRLVKDSEITVSNRNIEARLGHIRFFSATYRLFKLDGLEPCCEDYGQAVRYKGTIPGSPHSWTLDGHHTIETGKMFPVCGNTWRMIHDTRFAPHFEYFGDMSTHYGIFEGCGTSLPFASASGGSGGKGGSCC